MSLPQGWRTPDFGRQAEIDGAAYLRGLGFRVVASRFQTREGEIDLVAWDGHTLVFVEVKARRSAAPPEDSVGSRKQQRVRGAAREYMRKYRQQDAPFRFDILAVSAEPGRAPEFRLLRDVFTDGRPDTFRP